MKEHKNHVFLAGNRNGYSPDQCKNTMTVGELIEFLQDYDEEAKIFLRNDNGYTYGSINQRDFTTSEDYEEDEEE